MVYTGARARRRHAIPRGNDRMYVCMGVRGLRGIFFAPPSPPPSPKFDPVQKRTPRPTYMRVRRVSTPTYSYSPRTLPLVRFGYDRVSVE